ncbi:CRAL-TRIO lipid binding domain [Trypanosoma melophagium]|uniref:CRAL-TRIO lipid binding domain n=1 Tax=Trypanosoma melophagium TaxID=715481 RepID=UPI00351A6027|nr:CRAL-TRIO lipid binding domain [Trypanosoma melophagium]
MNSNDFSESSYEKDHAAQERSGVVVFTPEQKSKNLLLYNRVKDILPLNDAQKVSDCDILYRFLISKRWNVDETEAAVRTYATLRKEQKLNYIMMEKYKPDIESTGSFLYGFDKEGCPIMWNTPDIPMMVLSLKNGYKTELLRVQMRVMETARFLSKERKVDRCTLVLDLCNLSISAVNTMTLSFAREMAKIMQEYYPEIMRRMLIFNAGWAVTGGWKVLRPFVDTRVQEKMHFFSGAPTLELLLPFIDADQIPSSHGGSSSNDDIAAALIQSELVRLTSVRAEEEKENEKEKEKETQCKEMRPVNRYVNSDAPIEIRRRGRGKKLLITEVEELQREKQEEEGNGNDQEGESQFEARKITLQMTTESGLSQLALEENDEFFSVCSSFSTDEDSAEEGAISRMVQIGSPEVLAVPHSDPNINEPTSSSSFYIQKRVRVTTGDDQETVVMNLTECADGKILGFSEGAAIGEMEDNIIYRGITDKMLNILAPSQLSSHHEERKMIGELLNEYGHRIHHYVIVCDAHRKARYLLKKSRLRHRVQIFRFVETCKVFTDSLTRHTVVGRKIKFAECLSHSEVTNDPAAWVMNAASNSGTSIVNSNNKNNNTSSSISNSNNNSNSNGSSKRRSSSKESSNNGRSNVSGSNFDVVHRLAERKGQTLTAYGELAKIPILELFTLLMGVSRVWEADLRRQQETKILRAKSLFAARLTIPTAEMFRRLRPRSTTAPMANGKEEESVH